MSLSAEASYEPSTAPTAPLVSAPLVSAERLTLLERLSGELGRYLMVAVVALVVDMAMLMLLRDALGTTTYFAAAAAFAGGLLTNYILSVAWVFQARAVRSPLVEFALFTAIGLVGLLLTELALMVGHDWWHLDYRLVKLLAVGGVFVWNFGVRKLLLFRQTSPAPAHRILSESSVSA